MRKISKIIAVMLASFMVLGLLPVMSYAYDNLTVPAGGYTVSGVEYYEDVYVNGPLTIESGAALYVNGHLYNGDDTNTNTSVTNYGVLTVGTNAEVHNYGKFTNKGDLQENGHIYNYIQLPAAKQVTYTSADDTYDLKTHVVNYTYSYVRGNETISDGDKVSYTDPSVYTEASGAWIQVPNGVPVYILINATEGENEAVFADTSRMVLSTGGLITYAHEKVNSRRGVFKFDLHEGVSCTVPEEFYKYKNVVRLFKITLPQNKGYYVETIDGTVGETIVEYGKNFEFHVVLNDEYVAPDLAVYWADLALQPDAKGWYEITGPITKKSDGTPLSETDLATLIKTGFVSSDNYAMAKTGGVVQSADITVMGVMEKDKLNTMMSIISMIKQIFEVIREVFSEVFGVFSGGDLSGLKDIFSRG